MGKLPKQGSRAYLRYGSQAAVAMALFYAGSAAAQTAGERSAIIGDEEILVTGTRIEKAGFDQPTPTTVVGEVELRQGQRPSLAAVLNDSPQFRATVTSSVSPGNTSSGSAPVDLRGLGTGRTLTLINKRRFVGQNNLNYIPVGLVERVEVVTGGASAAWGSDAVAGVVNILLKKQVEGITVGAQSGISSRGDGQRWGADVTMGTSFADGRGQLMFSAEYVNESSIQNRNSRPNLGSAAIVRYDPTSTTDLRQILVRDVNFGNQVSAGLITSGIFAGQMFNDDGTLRAYRGGQSLAVNPAATPFPGQVIGGADAIGLYDAVVVTAPVERISAFARATYDLGGATLWAEAAYGRSRADYRRVRNGFLPDIGAPANLTIQATNPFLSPAIRDALAQAGETSFTLGKFYDGDFALRYDGIRTQKEGAIGIDAALGGSWRARAHYSHGQTDWSQRIYNARIVSRFNNAINAVSSGGQIVCAINADADPANDDPNCRPLNLFGVNADRQDALNYIRGTQMNDTRNRLDAMAAEVQGDLFPLWAGRPITVAFGVEARYESQKSVSGDLDLAGAYGPLNLYGAPVSGKSNVKEGFAEIAVPLFEVEGAIKVDLNGAGRYSDYSRSGGIWSWKGGATVSLFDTLLLRGTRSRDIRAPTIGELFAVRAINVNSLVDQDSAGRLAANPNYNSTPQQVTTYSGGNPDLVPEISYTTTFGATFSPRFIRGFNLSVDYYDIDISGAIATLSATNLTLACRNGSLAACDRITRDATGTVTEVRSNAQNIARFQTTGIDIEASQVVPMSAISLPGTLRVRALASYVKKFIYDTGVSRTDTAGDVGGATANALPKWRGVLSFAYQDDGFGLDARIRYVGGGKFNKLLEGTLINNDIGSRTYVDVGAQMKVTDRFTLHFNVNNLFDRDPPLTTSGSVLHDVVGTYFTAGARATF
ncbi:MAG: TonB-dependent receptor [Alphaproteobacteria bacterium HGW-Alphaproteobacteria-13]|jgi:outer membrane receptor protein involved in Fe transport|nr:MAG: TonB-dependent receptor [Alphaproteobacteria bacterium HGW-Alphaproteobacteria-13]